MLRWQKFSFMVCSRKFVWIWKLINVSPICIGNHPITRMIMTTVRIDRGLADVFVNSFCRRSDIPLTSTRTWYLTCNYKWWENRLFYTNSHGETANLCPRNDLVTQHKDSVAWISGDPRINPCLNGKWAHHRSREAGSSKGRNTVWIRLENRLWKVRFSVAW